MTKVMFSSLILVALTGCAAQYSQVSPASLDEVEGRGDRVVQRDLTQPYVERPSDLALLEAYKQGLALENESKRLDNELVQRQTELLTAQKAVDEYTPIKASEESQQDAQEESEDSGVREFTIAPGTLKANVESLLSLYGWKTYQWNAANFNVNAQYTIEISSLEEGLEFLLKPYPVQARMISVNRTVLFVTKKVAAK